jgi:hypothetical protein
MRTRNSLGFGKIGKLNDDERSKAMKGHTNNPNGRPTKGAKELDSNKTNQGEG